MPEYKVITPIRRKGKTVAEGTVEMSEAEAKPLLAIGAVEAAGAAKPAGGKEKEKSGDGQAKSKEK